MAKVFFEGEQVTMVLNPNYKPVYSKDVSGMIGRITGIDTHMEYENLWIYEVTFSQYRQVQVFNPDTTPELIHEPLTLRLTADEIERVASEEEQ